MRYDYSCPVHGIFEVKKPMSKSSDIEHCPICDCQSDRIFIPISHTWGLGGWDFDRRGLGDNLTLRHRD